MGSANQVKYIVVLCPTLFLQPEFNSPFYSLVKTSVMMIGEMDFNDMFHPDSEDDNSTHSVVYNKRLHYENSTYTLFISFLILMSVIIMNLLVSGN